MSLATSALMVEANEKIVELEEKITRIEKVNAELVSGIEATRDYFAIDAMRRNEPTASSDLLRKLKTVFENIKNP